MPYSISMTKDSNIMGHKPSEFRALICMVPSGKKWLLFRYICIISSCMGIIFSHIGFIQSRRWSSISRLMRIIFCDTSTVFCDMLIISSHVFRIRTLSCSHFIVFSVLFLLLQPLFTLLYSLIPVFCFEFPVSGSLFGLLPSIILKLSSHPYL